MDDGEAERMPWAQAGGAPKPVARRRGRPLLVAGGLAVAAYLLWTAWSGTGTSAVFLLSGLDVAVVVRVDGQEHEVAPGQILRQTLSVGEHRIATRTHGGALVEEIEVEVPRGTDLVAYNVLGAAPLEVTSHVYAVDPADLGEQPEGQEFPGRSWVTLDDIDILFDPAPAEVRMVGKRRVLRRAAVAEGGWRTCVEGLAGKGRKGEATRLGARVAALQGDESSIAFASATAIQAGSEEATRFGEEAVKRWPGSVEAHRAWQGADRRTPREPALREEYLARHRAAPDDAHAGYLYARLLPNSEALPIYERLIPLHPDEPWLRRGIGFVLVSEARYADAVPHLERIPRGSKPEDQVVVGMLAQALAGSGAVRRAQALLREEVVGRPVRIEWAAPYACLANLPGADPAAPKVYDVLVAALGRPIDPRETVEPVFHALARNPGAFEATAAALPHDAARLGFRLVVRSFTDPEAAAREAAGTTEAAATCLDGIAQIAIACECLRLGDETTARRLYEGSGITPSPILPFEALRDPATAAIWEDLDVEYRAVLAVAASRRATDPSDRERLLAYARRYDVFRRVVP